MITMITRCTANNDASKSDGQTLQSVQWLGEKQMHRLCRIKRPWLTQSGNSDLPEYFVQWDCRVLFDYCIVRRWETKAVISLCHLCTLLCDPFNTEEPRLDQVMAQETRKCFLCSTNIEIVANLSKSSLRDIDTV